jgi:hypothetical protein
MSKDPKEPKDDSGEDFVHIGPPLPNGFAPCLRHRPDHTTEMALIGPTKEGESVDGEIISLSPREQGGFHVKVLHDNRKGPSKAVTRAYRNGWDNIFGKRQPVGQA